ncbi:MAG: FecR domain-containing protein [Deltaproteobacteria bacterium]|nr:FecR domain-containing protein [Deltaproteobacteria bacterium]
MPIFVSILLAIVWSLALPVCPQAEVVGHFQKVEGPVDLLKQGQLPIQAPKAQDGVEPGDVIRTKSQGRAQVKFVDDSVLTIAPGSRVAIESYMYDASKGSRKAVLQIFRGMVQTVVTKILKTQEPDFIMKTHTAVLGVRGTKTYTLLGPMATDVYNAEGKTSVRNIFAEVGGEVLLGPLQFSRIMANLTPTAAMNFQKQDLIHLDRVLITGEGFSMAPGTGGGPAPFALLDRPGLPTLHRFA